MTTLRTTVQGRRVEVDVPPDWPDGAEVEIQPVEQGSNGADAPMSPEEIARTLAAMELIESFDLTDAELSAWEAERRARKERDKAQFAQHADKLRRAWE